MFGPGVINEKVHPSTYLSSQDVIMVVLAGATTLLIYWISYCVFFHPLARYPGPLLAKFTNLYGAYHAWKGDIHIDILRCHCKFGVYVRYAPNRILINSPQALHDIYGHGAHVRKFDGYKILSSHALNTLTLSNKVQHARRRRVISQAFSESSLRMFESLIVSKLDNFCQIIRGTSLEGEWTVSQDMAENFNRLSFDLMTALSFNLDYRTMEDPRHRPVMQAIECSNIRLSVLWQAPALSLCRLDRMLMRDSSKAAQTFVVFLRDLLKSRLRQDESNNRDIFSFLQKCEDPETGDKLSIKELSAETATFIVAGSDTSSTAMAALIHYLAGSARSYDRVTEEVRSTFASLDEIRLGKKINSCVFLRACLDEALRLSPPGGGPLWRLVENDGTTIGDTFFPGGCEVGAGVYAMQNSPDNWENPTSFRPERWLEKGVNRPYFPFNIGPRSCVGKPLAVAQILLTIARLCWEFDFRRADAGVPVGMRDDEEPSQYVLKDHITGQKTGPLLCFCPRF
ncbi:cytochrome P450 [Pseudomassariella vexata]|uniref:Cytochrome P450 n=1 Tax=Pseudomassariella vexata TaxID=1141098 RepID=A0A1Y2DLN5_9PEZI|nr:cytochrome P450 [Pseudomassariella vexata]ORY60121.1 cytochrome P450 [Pseudomassariella vexata]